LVCVGGSAHAKRIVDYLASARIFSVKAPAFIYAPVVLLLMNVFLEWFACPP
jgi:hypothetical protein